MPTAAMAMLGSSGIGAVRMAAHSLDLEGANIEERKRPLLAAIFVAGGRSSAADAVWLLVRFGTLVVDGETKIFFGSVESGSRPLETRCFFGPMKRWVPPWLPAFLGLVLCLSSVMFCPFFLELLS
jgi:hypothetical protein